MFTKSELIITQSDKHFLLHPLIKYLTKQHQRLQKGKVILYFTFKGNLKKHLEVWS